MNHTPITTNTYPIDISDIIHQITERIGVDYSSTCRIEISPTEIQITNLTVNTEGQRHIDEWGCVSQTQTRRRIRT